MFNILPDHDLSYSFLGSSYEFDNESYTSLKNNSLGSATATNTNILLNNRIFKRYLARDKQKNNSESNYEKIVSSAEIHEIFHIFSFLSTYMGFLFSISQINKSSLIYNLISSKPGAYHPPLNAYFENSDDKQLQDLVKLRQEHEEMLKNIFEFPCWINNFEISLGGLFEFYAIFHQLDSSYKNDFFIPLDMLLPRNKYHREAIEFLNYLGKTTSDNRVVEFSSETLYLLMASVNQHNHPNKFELHSKEKSEILREKAITNLEQILTFPSFVTFENENLLAYEKIQKQIISLMLEGCKRGKIHDCMIQSLNIIKENFPKYYIISNLPPPNVLVFGKKSSSILYMKNILTGLEDFWSNKQINCFFHSIAKTEGDSLVHLYNRCKSCSGIICNECNKDCDVYKWWNQLGITC